MNYITTAHTLSTIKWLDIKPEMDYISVGDYILLTLKAVQAFFFYLRH